jgi:signal transduction histidine kinase
MRECRAAELRDAIGRPSELCAAVDAQLHVRGASEGLSARLGEGVVGSICSTAFFGAAERCPGCPFETGNAVRFRRAWRRAAHGESAEVRVTCEPLRVDLDGRIQQIVIARLEEVVRGAERDATLARAAEIGIALGDLVRLLDRAQLPDAAEAILRAAHDLLPDALMQFWDYDEDQSLLQLLGVVGQQTSATAMRRALRLGEGLAGLAAERRETILSQDVRTDPRWANRAWAAAEELAAGLALPLLRAERLCGVLVVCRRGSARFDPEARALLEVFASQAAAVLGNSRMRADEQARIREGEALLEAARAILGSLDLQESLSAIVRAAARASAIPHVKLLVRQPGSGALRVAAWVGRPAPMVERLEFPPGTGLSGIVAETGETLFVPDCAADPRNIAQEDDRALGIQNYLGLPIKVRGAVEGVLTFNSNAPIAYSSGRMTFFAHLAELAAVGLDNARHHAAEVRRGDELEALLQAARPLLTGGNLQPILERLLSEAARIAGTPHVKIMLLDPEGQLLQPVAVSGGPVPSGFSVRKGFSYSGTVAATREPLFVADTQNDPRNLLRERDREVGIRTYLGLPIVFQGQVLGVLTFNTTHARSYSPPQIAYLQSFADLAAVAIENARLYDALRGHADELNAAVAARTQEIGETNRLLQRALRHKSEFLANMSHELRTPLNSIIGFGQILDRSGKATMTERQQRHLGHILDSGEHLLRLINDILDLSKVEAGRMALHLEEVEVASLLEGLAAIARGLGGAKGLTVKVNIDPRVARIRADGIRLKQICYNLLGNAVKFTEEGGTITLTARPAASDAGGPDPWLEIAVADTGVGIKAEDLPRLFAPFAQLDPVDSKRYEGTGLGLALTRKLVALHGGRVFAASPGEGQGSTFTVLLPVDGPEGEHKESPR